MINEIQVGRLNGLLHKLLCMKEGSPAPTLATDIFPMLALEVDRPEWAHLKGDRLMGGYAITSAVAGENAHVQLENPEGSGVLVVVQQVGINNAHSSAQTLILGLSSIAAAGSIVTTEYSRDARYDGKGAARVRSWTGVGGVANPTLFCTPEAYDTDVFDIPFVVPPRASLAIYATTVNQPVGAWFSWTERAIEPSEVR